MAKPYFRQVPDFEYISRNKGEKNISEYIAVKNLFKRGKLREDIFGNLQFFEKYSIIGDERPDNVAYKFYGDSTLDWVVLLSNNILNIQTEWPLPQSSLDKFLLDKYGSYDTLYNGVHHHETIEIKNSLGITVLKGGLRISPKWKTSGNFLEIVNSKIQNIYAGDGTTATNIVTVETVNGIAGLKVGSRISINNVTEPQYNGKYVVKEILTTETGSITSFTYEIATVPDVASPILASPRQEEILFSFSDTETIVVKAVQDQSSITGLNYEVGTIEVYVNGNQLDENFYDATSGISIEFFVFFNEGDIIEIKSNGPGLVKANSYYYEYWDDGLGYSVEVPSTSFVKEVTNYDYENALQEEKRNIFILKPIYLNVVFNDMDDLMPYKEGSTQYVNATLKRGDNIRLYE